MPIRKSNELDFSNKKITMLIDARPGAGKSTLSLSAPKPLLVDLEDGVDRVEACYRKDTIVQDDSIPFENRYEAFVNDIKNEDLSSYETIVIDTLGKLIELITPVVIKENPVNGQKDGKTLSLKGYGAVSTKVKEFIQLIHSLNKHVIFIAHVTEISDGDVVKVRVNIPGSTKDTIWNDIDLGGYLEIIGKKRVINFTPCDRYDAKGTHGITGQYEIPILKSMKNGGNEQDNHFLTDLFNTYIEDIQSSQKAYSENSKIYSEAMKLVPQIQAVSNVDELNTIIDLIKNTPQALTSREELLIYVNEMCRKIGAIYDKETKRYVVNS